MNEIKRKLLIFAGLLSLAVLVDLGKFLTIGEPNIINWNSLIHPAWVISAIVLLVAGAYISQVRVWLFTLYFIIFAVALLNQYIGFWEVLTYNCMLFNLVFVGLYFLSHDKGTI